MAFTVSSLTDYTQKATELLREGVLFSENFANFSIQTGIKYIEPLNILDSTVYFQAGGCSLANSGDTVLTEKLITVATYAVKKSFCVQDLQKKNLPLLPGSMLDKLSPEVESVLTADILAKTKQQVEADFWLGTSGLINGWFKNLSACTGAISCGSGGTTITDSNVDEIFELYVKNITDAMWSRGVLTIHCSVAVYNMYKRNRIAANFYHDTAADANLGAMETWYFGYEGQIKVKAEAGLNGSNYVMLTWDKNLYIGYDEESEVSKSEYVHDAVTDLIWYKSYWKMGTQIAFCSEVIHNMY